MKNLEMLKTVYSVSDFLQWQKAGGLQLSPSFQRRPVWKAGAKSYLLDTIIRGLPIPIIFLRDQKTNLGTLKAKREVVDGQQRIRTLLSFIDPECLADYSEEVDSFEISRAHSKEYAGLSFGKLPADVRQRILDYQFSVHVIPAGIDDREVLQIFARMNATGVKLNDQEIRNAEWFGEFKTTVYELASEQLTRWRDWAIFTEYNIARMEEVELTSEFALLMIRGLSGKTQSALDEIYGKYDSDFPAQTEVRRRFRFVMDQIDESFGVHLEDTPFARKTLFYSLFAAVYLKLFGQVKIDKRVKPGSVSSGWTSKLLSRGTKIQNETAPKKVLEAASRRTTHSSSRKALVGYLLQG